MKREYEFKIATDDPAKLIKHLTELAYLPQLRSTTEQLVEFFKGLVRPIIIFESWTTICFIWATGQTVPTELWVVGVAILGEYGLERAVKRWKQI